MYLTTFCMALFMHECMYALTRFYLLFFHTITGAEIVRKERQGHTQEKYTGTAVGDRN